MGYPFQAPGTRHSIWIDLDSRDPLTGEEITALYAALEQLAEKRAEISEHIRKISQRLLLSGERPEN